MFPESLCFNKAACSAAYFENTRRSLLMSLHTNVVIITLNMKRL